jgi:hypothetical protein
MPFRVNPEKINIRQINSIAVNYLCIGRTNKDSVDMKNDRNSNCSLEDLIDKNEIAKFETKEKNKKVKFHSANEILVQLNNTVNNKRVVRESK